MMTMNTNTTMSLYRASLLPLAAPEYDLHMIFVRVEDPKLQGPRPSTGWVWDLKWHGDSADDDDVATGDGVLHGDTPLDVAIADARAELDDEWDIDPEHIVEIHIDRGGTCPVEVRTVAS